MSFYSLFPSNHFLPHSQENVQDGHNCQTPQNARKMQNGQNIGVNMSHLPKCSPSTHNSLNSSSSENIQSKISMIPTSKDHANVLFGVSVLPPSAPTHSTVQQRRQNGKNIQNTSIRENAIQNTNVPNKAPSLPRPPISNNDSTVLSGVISTSLILPSSLRRNNTYINNVHSNVSAHCTTKGMQGTSTPRNTSTPNSYIRTSNASNKSMMSMPSTAECSVHRGALASEISYSNLPSSFDRSNTTLLGNSPLSNGTSDVPSAVDSRNSYTMQYYNAPSAGKTGLLPESDLGMTQISNSYSHLQAQPSLIPLPQGQQTPTFQQHQPIHAALQSFPQHTPSEANNLNLIEKLELWNFTPQSKRESANSLMSIGSERSSLSLEESWGSSIGGCTSGSDITGNRLSSSSVSSFLSDSPNNSRMNRHSTSSVDSLSDSMLSQSITLPNHPLYHLNQLQNEDSSQDRMPSNFDLFPYHPMVDFNNLDSISYSSRVSFESNPDEFDNIQEADFSSLDITETGTRIYDNTNVFVKHLPPNVNDEQLRSYFVEFGEIISCKVMMNVKNRTSLGFGFIRFREAASAKLAIEKMTGFRMGKKKLLCKLSNKELPVVGSEPRTNLYVKHLPMSFDNEKLRKLFEKFGVIKEVKVMMDKNTGQSKQIGFVRFERQVAATRALFEMNNVILKDEDSTTPLNVHYAETSSEKRMRQVHQQARLTISQQFIAKQQKKQVSEPIPTQKFIEAEVSESTKRAADQNANLFIFHLPPDIKDKELNDLFSPFGEVNSVRVISDKNGVSKGFGFVKYTNFDDALRAISAMNGFKLGKKHIKVSFKQ